MVNMAFHTLETSVILFAFTLLRGASCIQPEAPSPIAAPLRELPWAQLNFLHTTDIHGWWGGHLQEASFSADWGDYVSFAKHLRDKADADGSDLLLIDTGDRVEGNAIYDSSKPRGKFTYEIAKEQSIDLISSGNHELYKANTAEGEFFHTVPDFKGNYLASNLDIYNPVSGKLEPLAPRFKKFTTKNQGIRILAFGFIFDFTGNANNTVVQRVEDTVKEEWFKESLKDKDLDLIIVFGHVDIRSNEYKLLFSNIRSSQRDTPIQFFGGHSHIRDYKIFDSKSVALESGRYMETLGFMSIDGLSTGGTKKHAPVSQKSKIAFSRRYIDNNLYSLRHHSNKDEKTFPTDHGENVSKAIGDARKSLGLGERYGCAPQDYWVSRRPYPHRESIFTWIENQLLPQSIGKSKRIKNGGKALVITNTGAIRFDIFKGAFTKDTKFLISPFTSGIRYVKDVPYKAASQVLKLLNNEGPIMLELMENNAFLQPPEVFAARYRPHIFSSPDRIYSTPFEKHAQAPMAADEEPKPFPGYTTQDDAGEDGDDTVHERIEFYNVPNCIQSTVGFQQNDFYEPDTVDLMYNEFIQQWILLALEYVGHNYTSDDTESFAHGKSFTDIMTDWVEEHWSTKEETCL
ncbi:ser/Thr protein phosphatase-like protein family [Cucurbitaria berberidis CBS 394.84]|uniref:Ser/Thr protein phosphatase-like protein family n=1 Tax=Cucurbitaria berberidis CBS 394.84 TaxID=1168544 RepID=A0A9P4L5X4_9PLEO|nr:ser/Thr protein phosphatase-like protein family [Cucurbitaria berberidis CBS 394.84]KAF1842453.1 ser/Thr protein phosphatase-like protein family [Cucurbitaria berberidis CBS 394.84]